MSINKISEVIKSVLTVTDNVLGHPATRGQVIQVIELIESFDKPEQPVAKVEKAPVSTATKVKSTKKSLRKKYTQPDVRVNWKELTWWVDEILDGHQHIIPYSDLAAILPISQMNATAIETHLRKQSRLRGNRTVSVRFDRAAGQMTVQAFKK